MGLLYTVSRTSKAFSSLLAFLGLPDLGASLITPVLWKWPTILSTVDFEIDSQSGYVTLNKSVTSR